MKMNNVANKLKTLITVGVIPLLYGCSLLPQASNDAEAVDAVSKLQRTQQYSGGYENRIGRHIYAGLGIGASRLEPDTSDVVGVDVNDRVEGAGQISIGMDLNRHLALELHSADLGSAGLSPPNGRINYHAHGASALYYVGKQRHNYRRQGLTGYGRAGVGFLENGSVGNVNFVQDNDAHLLVGAGIEYMTKIGLGLRAEAISFEKDINYGQLAMIYRTGARRSKRPIQIVKAPEPAPVVVPAIKVAEPEPVPEPIVEAPSVCDEFNGVLDGVNFHSDSAELTAEGSQVLYHAAEKLRSCEELQITVSAHTDSVGAEQYNQGLSERRARSVVQSLTERGINASRMTSTAYGETQPIDTNDTPEGRRRNRRVELIAQ